MYRYNIFSKLCDFFKKSLFNLIMYSRSLYRLLEVVQIFQTNILGIYSYDSKKEKCEKLQK